MYYVSLKRWHDQNLQHIDRIEAALLSLYVNHTPLLANGNTQYVPTTEAITRTLQLLMYV